MDNTINTNRNTLKEHMDMLFVFSSKVLYNLDHPLPIIEASKSLIGLDIDNPSRNLLKWLERYLQNFQPTYRIPENKIEDIQEGVLTIYELESLIKQRELKDSKVYLQRILQVADFEYIMELFFEISLEHSLDKALFCWSAYKSIKHMNVEEGRSLLFITLDCLLHSSTEECSDISDYNSFYFLCYALQMQQTPMIRSQKIYSSILYQLGKIECSEIPLSAEADSLFSFLNKKGNKGLQEYVSTVSVDNIDCEKILLLDAVRSAIRYGKNTDTAIKLIKGNI